MSLTATARPAGRNARFAAGLLDPDVEAPDFLAAHGAGPVARRYGVYRNNVVVGLLDALEAAYPSLRAIMGEQGFRRAARNFIAAHPPRSPMMQAFGAEFPDFLAGFAPLRASPCLAELARLERAWLEAWHAADAEPLSGAALGGLAPDQAAMLRFEPHPALALLSSPCPVADLFELRFGARPEIDLRQGQNAMVTRPALQVEVTRLDRGQFRLIDKLALGTPLGEAAESVLADEPQFDLAAALAIAIGAGAFACARVEDWR